MTTWRMPTARERHIDECLFAGFLEPSLAAEIASMPTIDFSETLAPLALRCDAWMWRTSQLLATSRRREPLTEAVAA